MKFPRVTPIFMTIVFGLISVYSAFGQSVSAPRTTADENFQIDIGESRVAESNYERSTSVEISTERQYATVFVRVGAIAFAQKIEIVLRGVTGNVRFRASLDELRRRIERAPESTQNNR